MEVVLVTAGAGFLGQHVIKHLHTRGPRQLKEIRCYDDVQFQKKLDYESRVPVKSFVGDLFDQNQLQTALTGVDTVIHLADVMDMTMFPDEDKMRRVNVEGAASVCRMSETLNVKRFILLSSVHVMVPRYTHKVNNTEMSPVPVGKWMFPAYCASKYEAEQIVMNSEKLQTFVARVGPLYGELDDPETSPIVAALKIAEYFKGTLPVVSAFRDSVMQHTYVGNAAVGILQVVEKMIEDETASKEVVFLLDETPFIDFYALIEPYLISRKSRLANQYVWFMPCFAAYLMFETAAQTVQHCYDLKPLLKRWPSARFLYNYLHNWVLFNGFKALTYLRYRPLYSYDEAVASSVKYYSSLSI